MKILQYNAKIPSQKANRNKNSFLYRDGQGTGSIDIDINREQLFFGIHSFRWKLQKRIGCLHTPQQLPDEPEQPVVLEYVQLRKDHGLWPEGPDERFGA